MNAIYVRADHVVSPYSDAVSSDAGNSGSQDNNIDNSTPFGRTEDSAWRYLSSDMRWKIVPRETRTTLSCERRRVPFWIRVDFAPLSARTSGVSGATSSQAGCNKTSQC